jgi:hypothetical protein
MENKTEIMQNILKYSKFCIFLIYKRNFRGVFFNYLFIYLWKVNDGVSKFNEYPTEKGVDRRECDPIWDTILALTSN